MTDNRTAEEKDWTIPEGDIIHVPDRLDGLFNRLGMQLRFHTISKRNEMQVIANMTKIADEHASLQCAEMKEEIEALKNDLYKANCSAGSLDAENVLLKRKEKQLQEEVERLRLALDEIAYPVKYMQMRAKECGGQLNGIMAVQLSESASHLKGIALQALSGKESKTD